MTNTNSYEQAINAILSGDWTTARQTCDRMSSHDPLDSDSSLLIALIEKLCGQSDNSFHWFQESIHRSHQRSVQWLRLAYHCRDMKMPDLTFFCLERAVVCDDENHDAWMDLHDFSTALNGFPEDPVLVQDPTASQPPIAFQMYSFFGRDQVARCVSRRGWRAYEMPLPRIMLHTLNQFPGALIDVGANSGFFSLLAGAAGFGPIAAFEPLPPLARLARKNVALNQIGDRIEVVELAVSNVTGTSKLSIPVNFSRSLETSAALGAPAARLIRPSVDVRTTTLDDWWKARPNWASSIAVLKIDVEEHEPQVLAGAEQLIAAHRPIIFLEVLPNADIRRLNDFTTRFQYRNFVILEHEARLEPVIKFHKDQLNHGLVPIERTDAFIKMLRGPLAVEAPTPQSTPAA